MNQYIGSTSQMRFGDFNNRKMVKILFTILKSIISVIFNAIDFRNH